MLRHRGNGDSEPFFTAARVSIGVFRGRLRCSGRSVHRFLLFLVLLSAPLPILECVVTTAVKRHMRENTHSRKWRTSRYQQYRLIYYTVITIRTWIRTLFMLDSPSHSGSKFRNSGESDRESQIKRDLNAENETYQRRCLQSPSLQPPTSSNFSAATLE